MDYRTGKCSQCGAEYKVPASFAHNVARCKKCKGVVHLSGASAAAVPAPPHPPARSTPPQVSPAMPAKRVVPKPEAPRPAVPEVRKTSPPARPAATPQPTGAPRGGSLERLKSERRPAESPAETATPAAHSVAARGTDPAGRRREKRAPKEKKPPMAAILSGVALVVVAAVLLLFKDSIFGAKQAAAEVASTPAIAAPSETPAPVQPQLDPAEEVVDTATGEPTPPEAKPKAAPTPKDPNTIDLAGIPDFQPTPDTSAEEWAQMNEWMEVWMDVEAGAAGNRAKLGLIKETRKAVPAILNFFKQQDFATKEGRSNGDQCQKALQQISNGRNFEWKYADAEHPYEDPNDVYFCKRVVEEWVKLWRQVEQSIEAWIKIAKLDEKDAQEAARLREMFGGQSAPVEPGSDDDLEVD